MAEEAPIEVEPSVGTKLEHDARRHIPEPPPVRLVSVADVHLPAAEGLEKQLDAFYVGLLKFHKDPIHHYVFRAENHAIHFDPRLPPVSRDAQPATMIEVGSLMALRDALFNAEIAFEAVRGVIPGHQHLALYDPAGNWLNVAEWRVVR